MPTVQHHQSVTAQTTNERYGSGHGSSSQDSSGRGVRVLVDDLIDLQLVAESLRFSLFGRQARRFQAGNLPFALNGQGMLYQESRALQPGDDIRYIDWRVTARSGQAHVKLFQQERDHLVTFLVDQSASMHFGTRAAFKSVQAARIATLMAWLAAAHGCRISGVGFNETKTDYARAQMDNAGVLSLIKMLAALDAQTSLEKAKSDRHQDQQKQPEHSKTCLVDTLTQAAQVAPAGASLVIVSDFYQLDEPSRELLSALSRRYQLTLVFVYDVLEREIPLGNAFNVTDGQQQYYLDGDNNSLNQAYRQAFALHQDGLAAFCLEYGLSFVSLATDQDLSATLVRHFAQFQGR